MKDVKDRFYDLGRYAGTYGGYRPDPPPSRYVRFRRWLQERLWRKGRKWRHASANVAFVRLERIIAADRAAVPCGRWVRCFPAQRKWQLLAEQALFCGRPIPMPPYGKELRPRYRWSERR